MLVFRDIIVDQPADFGQHQIDDSAG